MKKFKNKPNFQVSTNDGQSYWISRSVAVVAVPIWNVDGELYFPLGKRSEAMDLYPGHWGIPCGFLDWNESAAEAVRREVYEEIGLDLSEHTAIYDQPDLVISEPNPEENETISLRFVVAVSSDSLPPLSTSQEAPEVKWVKWSELTPEFCKSLAFNHADIIRWAVGVYYA